MENSYLLSIHFSWKSSEYRIHCRRVTFMFFECRCQEWTRKRKHRKQLAILAMKIYFDVLNSVTEGCAPSQTAQFTVRFDSSRLKASV